MAVAVVNTGIGAGSVNDDLTLTLSTTLTAGANLLVVWTDTPNPDTNSNSGVTYNGSAMTLLGSCLRDYYGNKLRSNMWYLENPSTGSAYNIVSTWTENRYFKVLFGASFSGYGSFGTLYSDVSGFTQEGTSQSISISDWASGDYAVAGIITESSTPTSSDTVMSTAASYFTGNCAYQTANGNMEWTTPGNAVWNILGAAIKPSSSSSLQYKLLKPSIIRAT